MRANPLCAGAKEREQDNTPNNYESIGMTIDFGKFRYLDLTDLTWNQELQLVCPQNLLGTFQLYRTSRHGTDWAGAEVMVHAVRPRVAVMNNNPTKGGTPGTFQIVRSSPGLEDFWQLHYSDFVSKDVNSPDNFIANFTKDDGGQPHQGDGAERRQLHGEERAERVHEGVSSAAGTTTSPSSR